MNQPLSYVHPNAKIAQNVVIEPFSTIYNNVEIGEGTWIGPNVTIMEGARIGKNCRIFPGAVISAIPQDLKFNGEETLTIIGDNNTIREYVTINRGTKARGQTIIGDNNLLMAYVHIAHDCKVGSNCIFVNNATIAGEVVVEDWAIISAMSAVHQFVRIGAHSYISGASLVRKDVPPFVKVAREPISYVGINSVGLRRRGYSNEKIREIQNIYRIILIDNKNVSKSIEHIETNFPDSKEKDEILMFIRNSCRGIVKGYTTRNGKSEED